MSLVSNLYQLRMEKASTLLNDKRFWEIIDSTVKNGISLDKQAALLKNELMALDEKELVGFRYNFFKFMNNSYRSQLWAVAYIVMGGCSDDGFDYFRMWLITRGKKVFDAALENPDSLCNKFDNIAEGDMPEFEDASYIPGEVMKEKFSMDIYDEEDNYEWTLTQPEIDFDWDEDDEESMRNAAPNTFDKWWLNDRF